MEVVYFFSEAYSDVNGFAGGSHCQSSGPDFWKKRSLAAREPVFRNSFLPGCEACTLASGIL